MTILKVILERLAILLVLWLPFSLASVAAALTTFFVVLLGSKKQQQGYGKDVLRAMDKVLAAVLGYSGYYTTSAELGFGLPCRFGWRYTWMRVALDKAFPRHCEGAARNEGLMPSIENGPLG